MSDTPLFMTMDGSVIQGDLLRLICRMVRDKGRIEVTNCEGETCVMLSKAELDGLEQALDILAKDDRAREIARTVEQFVMPDGEATPSS